MSTSETPIGENYVGWCRYMESPDKPTRIVMCDSDSPGAFRVYHERDLATERAAREKESAEYKRLMAEAELAADVVNNQDQVITSLHAELEAAKRALRIAREYIYYRGLGVQDKTIYGDNPPYIESILETVDAAIDAAKEQP